MTVRVNGCGGELLGCAAGLAQKGKGGWRQGSTSRVVGELGRAGAERSDRVRVVVGGVTGCRAATWWPRPPVMVARGTVGHWRGYDVAQVRLLPGVGVAGAGAIGGGRNSAGGDPWPAVHVGGYPARE